MHELLEILITQLVDQPDAVKVETVESVKTVVYEVTVAPEDMGKIIGKQGRTANALRTLLTAMSGRGGEKRAMLEIIE